MIPRPPIERFGDTSRHPRGILLILVLIPAVKLELWSLVVVGVGRHVDNLDCFDVPQPVPFLGRACLPLAEFQAFLRRCGGHVSGIMARGAELHAWQDTGLAQMWGSCFGNNGPGCRVACMAGHRLGADVGVMFRE
jgi:hypothetical protein